MTTKTKTTRYAATQIEADEAVAAGKAFLETFTGTHRVVGFRHDADCNVITNNHPGDYLMQQSWASDYTQIKIVEE